MSCPTTQSVKTSVGSQIGVVSASAELEEGEQEYVDCATVNPGYSGGILVACKVLETQWGGQLMANASECMCDNPYDVGTDNYFCHKYMYCYQKHGLIMNPSQCQFDCTQIDGWQAANIPWADTPVEAKPYGTTVKTLEVRCAGSPNMRSQGGGALTFGPEDSPWDRTFTVDSSCGDVVTTVVETVEEHGGHVATNNWENVLADDGVVQSGGHCLPFEVTDFNECVNEAGRTHTCSPDAICSNTLGSFTCACKQAFDGDGFTCVDKPGCLNGRCFAVFTDPVTFDVAEASCRGLYPASQSSEKLVGHIASVHSHEDQDFIFDAIVEAGVLGDYWLGMRQDAEYEPWWWTDGSEFDWIKWKSPDPDNLPDQMCGLTRNNPSNSKHGYWFDLECEKGYGYVCQYHP